jgi:alpha-mannosidase
VAVPAAQLLGERTMRFALMPHTGSWSTADVLTMAERYQHAALAVRASGLPTATETDGVSAPIDDRGLSIEGDGVVLTALRRRGEWLELRIVAENATRTEAVVRGPFQEARDADLLGRPLGSLPTEPGLLHLSLGPWEIRTVQLRAQGATLGP